MMICVYFTNMHHHILLCANVICSSGDATTNLKMSPPYYIMHKLLQLVHIN